MAGTNQIQPGLGKHMLPIQICLLEVRARVVKQAILQSEVKVRGRAHRDCEGNTAMRVYASENEQEGEFRLIKAYYCS